MRIPLRGQLSFLPAPEMPPAPLEKDLVVAIRKALEKLGYLTWSGRVAVHERLDALRAVRPLREAWDRGERLSAEEEERVILHDVGAGPPFLPSLGPGTPDILGIFPERQGRLFGLECKRARSDKERVAQLRWHERARFYGIPVATVRSIEEAIEFLESHRAPGDSR